MIFDNIASMNQGPLTSVQLRQIYERLVDVSAADSKEKKLLQNRFGTPRLADGTGAAGLKEAVSYQPSVVS